MADIFISYSKPDRDKVVMLAAYLESEGWTVWWDKNLNPGEPYRDEIIRELAKACAVIALWSQTSIKSDFVRAEAGQAKAQGKLIPVKEGDVAYGDIPLPFGEMHTEELSKKELIGAAVVAQLAKPQVQPSPLWVASKTLRYQVLTWVGIVGGAITLFANLRGVLDLADWAKWLVTNWHALTVAFWLWAFDWIGIRIAKEWAPLLSFAAFSVMTAFGARVFASARANPPSKHLVTAKSYAGVLIASVLFYIAASELLLLTRGSRIPGLTIKFIFFSSVPPSLALMYLNRRDKYSAAIFSILFTMFYALIFIYNSGPVLSGVGKFIHATLRDLTSSRAIVANAVMTIMMLLYGLLLYIFPAIMLTICPLRAITKRLVFLAIGLIFLIVINQLSLFAPHIRELLKPPGS